MLGVSGATDSRGEKTLLNGQVHSNARKAFVVASAVTDETIDEMAEFYRRSGDPYPFVYDKVIRCLGWKHSTEPHVHT